MRSVYIDIIVIVGLLLLPGTLQAQTVYVSRGPDGELSFSDQPSDDVEQVFELPAAPSPLAAAAAETSAARVTELLRVADALADSREARERLRAARRARNQPQTPPPAVPVDSPVAQQPLWYPPLLAPGPGFRAAGWPEREPAYAGRRYPGDGRYDRRDPRLEDRLLPEREPRRRSPLPPR